MRNRLLITVFAFSIFIQNGLCKTDTLSTSKIHCTVGLSYNPFLALMEKKQELGPSLSLGYAMNKRFETGFNWFTRQMIHAPNNDYKQLSNLKSRYNLESVYSMYFAVEFSKNRFSHLISADVGLRHDLYKETLNNPKYEINQTYRNSEWNALFGMAYTCRYKLSSKSALSIRFFAPFNRHPFDDALKYSLEPGYVFYF